jgi:hypothetical protein
LTGTIWFTEGDISDCFGSLSHEILLGILAEKIHDQRFLRLIRNMLRAGYLEDWEYHETLSRSPQSGVVSPILSSIYLHKLDEFVEQELIPQYTRGASRRKNPECSRIQRRLKNAKERGDRAEARDLKKQLRSIPCGDPADPGYRRLRYTRYADLCRRRHKSASGSPFSRACYEARRHREGRKDLVARFGGITLRQDRRAVIPDPAPGPEPHPSKELVKGSADGNASSARPAPRWRSTRSPASRRSGNQDRASPWRPTGSVDSYIMPLLPFLCQIQTHIRRATNTPAPSESWPGCNTPRCT